GVPLGDEPGDPAAAYRAMADSVHIGAPRTTDARFVLTIPGVPVDPSGGFQVTFAVVRANSLAGLCSAAEGAIRKFAAGTSTGLAPNGTGTLALRQSLAHQGTGAAAASPEGATSPTGVRAQLRQRGITALVYDLPQGQEVM